MNINTMTIEEQRHIGTKLEELKNSDGWHILCQIMAAERETLFRKFANPAFNPHSENINYHRGTIEASYLLAELPTRTLAVIENNIRMAAATTTATTPTPAAP